MWKRFGTAVLHYRSLLLLLLAVGTAFMAWQASKVQLSYEFSKSIPTDNPKYVAYQAFKKQFGEDGNLMVIGLQRKTIFDFAFFFGYKTLQQDIKKIAGVEDVLSVPSAVNLQKDAATERLQVVPLFGDSVRNAVTLDSAAQAFYNLPFYKGLLYNSETGAWLMGVRINNKILSTPKRAQVVDAIVDKANAFEKAHSVQLHLSGLPLIRTQLATRIQKEMRAFLLGSVVLSALILLLFFRSIGATLLSLLVVAIGVVFSLGTLQLMGYKITLLTALIPPLVVVIGIPNCIYFLNKYHTAYLATGNKQEALVQMVSKMGVVTLFCNIAAAIGFAVFYLTSSEILKEFGAVAGINILLLFFISLILIPGVLSFLPAPKERHLKYLHNRWLQQSLVTLERWALQHRKTVYALTGLLLVLSALGIMRLKSVGFIVDDLPKTDRIYIDLQFFEKNFKGVMPLEVVVDTKKKYGVSRNLVNLERIDSLVTFLKERPYIGRPLSITEGLKFAKQAFFEGDSTNYSMPSEYDLPALAGYLSMRSGGGDNSAFGRLVGSFMDSARQKARISVSMQDVGSARLPLILDTIQTRTQQLFDSSKYVVTLTGTSVTFLEGSTYIINGLKESVFWAFLLIAVSMLYLFRSVRILLCSLIPNLVPLVVTAGVMGWAGVPLKPSTVLVFSVALGIAIDITIRFLVSYRQDKSGAVTVLEQVAATIKATGVSIIYTSIVLIAGFVIFCFSSFGGTQALGWLTSLTLVTATVANLVLLPALLVSLQSNKSN